MCGGSAANRGIVRPRENYRSFTCRERPQLGKSHTICAIVEFCRILVRPLRYAQDQAGRGPSLAAPNLEEDLKCGSGCEQLPFLRL